MSNTNNSITKEDTPDNDTNDEMAVVLPIIDDTATAFSHEPQHGFSLFLAKRTKTIHFVRHAEGLHNQANAQAGDDTPVTYSTPGSDQYIDAKLTLHGIEQCMKARQDLLHDDVHPQLIVVSPFTRTLQTAHILFSGNNIPFVVHDLARERSGQFTCDKRRNKHEIIQELKPLYDHTGDTIDFDSYGYPQDDDVYWTHKRELDVSVLNRAIRFVQWLASRPETEMAVVTHSSWLKHLFRAFGQQHHPKDQSTLHRLAGNAEVRSVCLALHRGFYPPGVWDENNTIFVPNDMSFRRGKWAPTQQQVATLHTHLLQQKTFSKESDIVNDGGCHGTTQQKAQHDPDGIQEEGDGIDNRALPLDNTNFKKTTSPIETKNENATNTSTEPKENISNNNNNNTTVISLSLLDVTKAVTSDPNGQQLLLKLNDDKIVFLNHACTAQTYLTVQLPSKQETASVHHQITKFLQTKDKYTAAASMLFKSQAFLQVHQHNPRVRPTHLVDLPRTDHNKPYIPVSADPFQSYQLLPDDIKEDEVFPLSVSHQYPLVGLARTIHTEPGADAPLVGLDIVIFDTFNPKLYETEQEFLDVFRDSFTNREWNCIDTSSSKKMQEFYVRWAMKEAYTKARGLGMGVAFNSFEISLDDVDTIGDITVPSQSVWKYILKAQRKAVADYDGEEGGYVPGPLKLDATVRFLMRSVVSRKNERYSFFFLPLENGQAKGCACVCVGPTKNDGWNVTANVSWTSLNELMVWHGGDQQAKSML
ncbi:phosphoglycerate mutase family protein [Nitzschia inconspicua]|uniref:Phosphoglycerate mutase family protein n=1 Tax=Nitzschia inconspicua TaxID=303405 RepID=A0A9K3KJK3_9STRA|nr:phosphoglycerate mutase family protein [Nitzschia inconspicua]